MHKKGLSCLQFLGDNIQLGFKKLWQHNKSDRIYMYTRKLSEKSSFGTYLEEAILDRIACSLRLQIIEKFIKWKANTKNHDTPTPIKRSNNFPSHFQKGTDNYILDLELSVLLIDITEVLK